MTETKISPHQREAIEKAVESKTITVMQGHIIICLLLSGNNIEIEFLEAGKNSLFNLNIQKPK